MNPSMLLYPLTILPVFYSALASMDTFILAGQSNMAGRGGVENGKWNGVVPYDCRPNPSILRFSSQLKWEVAREPLHVDIDVGRTCGVGPGMAFANRVRVNGSGIGLVGLVPCAVGGTRIGEWARGARLYNSLVKRAIESVRNGGGVIRGVLWYQGESDTRIKEDAKSYKVKMERLILNLRDDLNLPSLPVIQVALASGEGKFREIVRKAQLSIKLPNVKCVDAKGLDLKTDHLHLTTTSEAHLGLVLANAFIHYFSHTL